MNQQQNVVAFTDEDVRRAREFAQNAAPWNYNRGGVDEPEGVRRLLVGKLGEIAFSRFLQRNDKRIAGNEHMFEVWEDVYAADLQDFLTGDNRTIDIKTASRDFHRRITIPEEHFVDRPADFYAGIRIAEDLSHAVVVGYASHDYVRRNGTYRGPDPARNYQYASYDMELRDLLPIQELLDLIDDE